MIEGITFDGWHKMTIGIENKKTLRLAKFALKAYGEFTTPVALCS